ncbi:MAG TPA: radical SAM protein [Longimicrobium sp.]|nr:radical SAM protein [Longimicrobium sp.]
MQSLRAAPPASAGYLLPVLHRWLFHAPLHGIAALVNTESAAILRADAPEAWPAVLHPLRAALSAAVPAAPRPLEGDVCPSFLGIIPTRGCNLGCVYCNFGGPTASRERMDPRVAVAAVDWMAKRLHEAGRELFQIHFFGGEPFVAPEVVDVVVHRARYMAARYGLRTYVDASTNGVFDEARCRFVGDYFGGVVLSFDGFPEHHDRTRPGKNGRPTFEAVARTARRLAQMPLDLCIRVCVTQDSVARLEEITDWMCTEFSPAVVNFETLTPGELATAAGLRVPDPYEFAAHCVGAYRVAESHGIRAVYSAAEHERVRLSFCPVGTDALIVSLDGRVSACYLLPEDWRMRGLDMDLGSISPDGGMRLDRDAVARARRLPAEKPRCDGCFCRWSCAGGCHVNQTYPGSSDAYTDFCIQTRLVTACLLLRELGQEELVDELLAHGGALRALAGHAPDTVDLGWCTHEGSTPAAVRQPRGAGRSLVADGMTLLG